MTPDQKSIANGHLRQIVAVLCLSLISVLSVAQIAHNHENDANAAQHCSVCFAAHLSLAKSATVVALPTLLNRVSLTVERESLTALLLTENAHIRPPPIA